MSKTFEIFEIHCHFFYKSRKFRTRKFLNLPVVSILNCTGLNLGVCGKVPKSRKEIGQVGYIYCISLCVVVNYFLFQKVCQCSWLSVVCIIFLLHAHNRGSLETRNSGTNLDHWRQTSWMVLYLMRTVLNLTFCNTLRSSKKLNRVGTPKKGILPYLARNLENGK